MKPALSLLAAAALVAACATSGAAPSYVDGRGNYIHETGTEDLTVSIRIPAAVYSLPGVGGRLAASAESEVAQAARRAADGRREGWNAFVPSELLVEWTVVFESGGVLSALGETNLSEGGVPSRLGRESVLFDQTAGREIGIADLFSDPREGGAAMTAISEAALASWAEQSPRVRGRDLALVDERTMTDARESLRPRPSSFGTFTLIPARGDPRRLAALALYYPAGQLGPPADGPYRLIVPAAVIAPHLDPAWAARLGVGG